MSALSQRRVADASEASLHTLGSFVLALQVQDGATATPGGTGEIVEILSHTGPINLVVFVILVLFSIASWAIILAKILSYRKVERQSATFLEVFRNSQKFSEVQAVCPSLPDSPLVGVFQAGYAELNAQFRLTSPSSSPGGASPRPMLKSLDAVDRALIRAATAELNRLEHRLTFLATTASITPFIGLFGTVVGIMITFNRIAQQGSTNLTVVGPGISEALIATAAGLFAAIPAVYFYNYLTHRVKELSAVLDDFSLEFLNIAERNFT
ncbi:MAG TPA: MotA/TolQ/ExbB proton channel family protein [Vicinamibacterales bacterium]|nr:MotA/TolQ/ExbB proton channel family protein [Vicinamibacterales bacterium]